MSEREELKEKIKKAARMYANLKEDFDIEEETYYQKEKIDIYNAFLAGVRCHEALHF